MQIVARFVQIVIGYVFVCLLGAGVVMMFGPRLGPIIDGVVVVVVGGILLFRWADKYSHWS